MADKQNTTRIRDMDRLLFLDARDLQAAGLSRAYAYQLLNRADMPVISFGKRKYMIKAEFEKWLKAQGVGGTAAV